MNSYKIIYTCGGDALEISPDSPCRLVEDGLHGFDCTGFDVRISSYAASHGGYVRTRRFAERELSLTFEIDAFGEERENIRRKIISMLSPETDGVLDITLFGVHRTIEVSRSLSAAPSPTGLKLPCILLRPRYSSGITKAESSGSGMPLPC